MNLRVSRHEKPGSTAIVVSNIGEWGTSQIRAQFLGFGRIKNVSVRKDSKTSERQAVVHFVNESSFLKVLESYTHTANNYNAPSLRRRQSSSNGGGATPAAARRASHTRSNSTKGALKSPKTPRTRASSSHTKAPYPDPIYPVSPPQFTPASPQLQSQSQSQSQPNSNRSKGSSLIFRIRHTPRRRRSGSSTSRSSLLSDPPPSTREQSPFQDQDQDQNRENSRQFTGREEGKSVFERLVAARESVGLKWPLDEPGTAFDRLIVARREMGWPVSLETFQISTLAVSDSMSSSAEPPAQTSNISPSTSSSSTCSVQGDEEPSSSPREGGGPKGWSAPNPLGYVVISTTPSMANYDPTRVGHGFSGGRVQHMGLAPRVR